MSMTQTVEAIFDGTVLRPDAPLALSAGSRVRVTVETLPPAGAVPYSFLAVAEGLELSGPADWSQQIDTYLYASPDGPAEDL